ncbi:MAG: DNA polymerase I, partial [Pirellulales bacterium]|nr:DNA polymerase I [Pirellulales bacterium]
MPERPKQNALPGFEPQPEENAPSGQSAFRAPHSALPPASTAAGTEDGPARESPHPSSLIPHPSLSGKSVWVIDAHSLIHQVFHALPEMTSPRGEPVGAVFGFTRDLLFLLEEKRPDYLFCAFDLPGKTFRHEIYTAYKEQRPEMDVDLVPQIAACRRVLEVLGVPALGCEGFEADDVLATVARLTVEHGGQCYIITADKDCRQLLGDRVRLYNIRKNAIYDAAALKEDWGIAPEQVVDFQALVGDAVDNVPGVPGIG